jgi:cell wall-associated NlpC family hydrolase
MRIGYTGAIVALSTLVTLFAGCATTFTGSAGSHRATVGAARAGGTASGDSPGGVERAEDGEVSSIQRRVAQAALSFVGENTDKLYVGNQEFRCDCTGVVLASYYKAGIDLMPVFAQERGNGVARLHGIADRYRLLAPAERPQPGDIVFWDDTYDHNADGKWGDPLTHAGIVVDVAPDGQLTYVHHNYRRGVVTAQMNLQQPDTHQLRTNDGVVTVNSPMRMKSHRYIKPDAWLSSHLFRSFGRLTALPVN